MNAIRQLYRNAGLVTEDGYVKVRDGLWVKLGPYEAQSWRNANNTATLPAREELNEIHLKFQELIQIQEICRLPSLKKILESRSPWVWSSTKCGSGDAWTQAMIYGNQDHFNKVYSLWVIPIRRSV